MESTHLFQLSLPEAESFIKDCVQKTLEHTLQQSGLLSTAGNQPPTEVKLMNTNEVCELLQITRLTCDTWRKHKKLPYKRIGGRIYFDRQEVLASLQSFNRRAK